MGTKVHQALYGYSDGHRQLACSAPLNAKDSRLALIMSDVSGPGVAAERTPYITGYPLQESGLYAIAMTWPAFDLPRPGCVWTHTLFIEFPDLGALESPSILCKLFRQPSIEQLAGYDNLLQVRMDDSRPQTLLDSELHMFARLASALYGNPNAQIWARRESDSDIEGVALRLWDQQFPRLRRSFKFCTLTTKDRSQEGLQFDLQLCPGNSSIASLRFSNASEGWEATSITNEPWMNLLLVDARHPKQPLRKALRVLGADVLGGREAMKPICQLFAALGDEQYLHSAIELVQGDGQLSTSTMARGMVLRAALLQVDSLAETGREFVIEGLSLLSEDELQAYAPTLAASIWRIRPATLLELCFDDRAAVQVAMREAVQAIPEAELLSALMKVPDWVARVLDIRRDLAESPEFWAQSQHWPRSALIGGVELTKSAVLSAMILGLREDGPIAPCLHEVGAFAVLECLRQLTIQRLKVPQLEGWIRQACMDTDAVAHFLSQPRMPTREVVSCIAKQVPPDVVPNDFGEDPWFVALSEILRVETHLSVELLAYGFRRAIGSRTKSVAPLLVLTFEAFHNAATEQTVPRDSWLLVEDMLPWVVPDDSWDYGLRVRKAVARRCIDMHVRSDSFCALAGSDFLFSSVIDEVWDLWGGPRYLKTVEQDLRAFDLPGLRKRRQLLAEYIKKRSSWW